MPEYPPTNFMRALKYINRELIDTKNNQLLVFETVFDDGSLKASVGGKLFPISLNGDDVVLLRCGSDEGRLREYLGKVVMVKTTDGYLVGILEDVSFKYPPTISLKLYDEEEGTRVKTFTDFSEVCDLHGNRIYTNPLVRDEDIEKLIEFLKSRKVSYELCNNPDMREGYERPVHTEGESPLSEFLKYLCLVRTKGRKYLEECARKFAKYLQPSTDSLEDRKASHKYPQDPWTN